MLEESRAVFEDFDRFDFILLGILGSTVQCSSNHSTTLSLSRELVTDLDPPATGVFCSVGPISISILGALILIVCEGPATGPVFTIG